jgi:hypothetical protein
MTYSESPTDVATAASFPASTPISPTPHAVVEWWGSARVAAVMAGADVLACLTIYGGTFTYSSGGEILTAEFAPSAMLAGF